ncbi:MAG: peptide-methionine (R)-S-oxide reductase MsrB [Candidatus Nanohaloarchaea archaeon]
MDFQEYLTKKLLALTFVAILLVGGVAFQQQITSGISWMAGTQDIDLDNERFGDQEIKENSSRKADNSKESNSSDLWVQETYQDEISNLSDVKHYVTQENGTEPPFKNEYYDNHRDGIYVDIVSGAPLFSSKHKFDSGTGWPSFYKPLEPENLIERKDPGPLGDRVEIAVKQSKTHLGHLFQNPDTPTGLRYCMNSASLEFIPAEELEERGYGQYSSMFKS